MRRIEWIFDKLESIFLYSSHGHCGPVCQRIVLVEEHSSWQFSTLNLLDFHPYLSRKISIIGSGDSVPLYRYSTNSAPEFQKMEAIILPADIPVLVSLGGGEPRCFHCFDCCLVSGWK